MPTIAVSYTHLRAHETVLDLVCRLLLEKKNGKIQRWGMDSQPISMIVGETHSKQTTCSRHDMTGVNTFA